MMLTFLANGSPLPSLRCELCIRCNIQNCNTRHQKTKYGIYYKNLSSTASSLNGVVSFLHKTHKKSPDEYVPKQYQKIKYLELIRCQEEDYYSILGVERNASTDEIKKAFRRLARRYHPDVNKEPNAKQAFQKLSEAYEVLSDPQMRSRYDQFGMAGVKAGAATGASGFADFGDFGDFGAFSDIFETFFGGGGAGTRSTTGSRRRRTGPQQGEDLRLDLEVDFEKAIFGGQQKIKISHLETCSTCSGSGIKPGSREKTCSTCGGQGMVMQVARTPLGTFQQTSTCPTCQGAGQVVEDYCPSCNGQGRKQASKQLVINIPPGVDNGSRLRVRNEGDAGTRGGPSGDLYVFLKVSKHKTFRREGMDIYSTVEVSYLDAILGTRITVPTVDGNEEIEIPLGTQPGAVIKIPGKGVPKLGNKYIRGDHYITVNVILPKKLSSEQRQLVEKLRALESREMEDVERSARKVSLTLTPQKNYSSVQTPDKPSQTALCLQTQQSLLGINGSRIGKLAARVATLIQLPSKNFIEKGTNTSAVEDLLERDYECFRKEVYSTPKPTKRRRTPKKENIECGKTESALPEIYANQNNDKALDVLSSCSNSATKEELKFRSSGELAQSAGRKERRSEKDEDSEISWKGLASTVTSADSCCSSNQFQAKGKRGRPRKNKETESSNELCSKQQKVEATPYPVGETQRTYFVAKNVDELLERHLSKEHTQVKKKTKASSSFNWKNNIHGPFEGPDPESTSNISGFDTPSYSREVKLSRLQQMFSKNMAGQFKFDLSDTCLIAPVQYDKQKKLDKPKLVSKENCKRTRRIKLRLYLPS
eukprot:jgi/Galph1/4201/GphlegSOOS_G2876.1